jgi:hypothetical protein
MKHEAVDDALLRQFLLGKVDEEMRAQIESLFLTDPAIRERVLAAEQDLIEDYLEDSLSADDKERFLARYAKTPEQQRSLRITRSIKDWAMAESAASVSGAGAAEDATRSKSPVSVWRRLGWRPAFVFPALALIILAIVLSIFGVNRWREERRHFAIEQELARLNSPSSLAEVQPGAVVLALTPLTLRGTGSESELKPPGDNPYIELRLRSFRPERYSTYEATVRRIRDDQTYTIRDLRVDDSGIIRVRLLPQILTRGTYQVRLSGLNADGSAALPEEYVFTVGG